MRRLKLHSRRPFVKTGPGAGREISPRLPVLVSPVMETPPPNEPPAAPRVAPMLSAMPFSSNLEAPAEPRRESTSWSSLRGRARILQVLLGFYVLAAIACGFAWVTLVRLPQDHVPWRMDEGPPVGVGGAYGVVEMLAAEVTGGVFLVAFMAVAVFFCLWLWRAIRVVRRFGNVAPLESAAMSVWWFFLPVVSFWKPYVVLGTLSQAACTVPDWDNVPRSQLVVLWWAAWIGQVVSLAMGLTFMVLIQRPEKVLLEVAALGAFFTCGVVAALCLFLLVRQITKNLGRQLGISRRTDA